jgi:signal transduction histidine kinase
LTVADNGCGIAPEIESLVFDLLRTNKDTGIGIGLWLSKTIVESHKGKIHFVSALNTGTTFRVELPSTNGIMFF